MTTLTTTKPQPNTEVDAAALSSNFTAIEAVVNGQLDTSNWATGKVFPINKLQQGGANTGEYLQWNGSDWDPATIALPGNRTLDISTGDVDVTNTTTETSLYSYTVPANTLGTNRLLHLIIMGDFLQNTIGDTVDFKLQFGGNTVFHQAGVSFSQNSLRVPFDIHIYLANDNSASAQIARMQFLIAQPTGAIATGIGQVRSGGGGDAQVAGALGGTQAADTTSDRLIDFRVKWSAATTSTSFRKFYALTEIKGL